MGVEQIEQTARVDAVLVATAAVAAVAVADVTVGVVFCNTPSFVPAQHVLGSYMHK